MPPQPPPQQPPVPPAPQPGGTEPPGGESSTGLEPGLASLLAYLFGIVGGLVFYLIEQKNKYVRFHAMQSILLFAVFIVVWVAWFILEIILPSSLTCLLSPVVSLVGLAYLILTIVLMIKAYQGEKFKLPIIGDIAERQA